jgi:hypothetical protein
VDNECSLEFAKIIARIFSPSKNQIVGKHAEMSTGSQLVLQIKYHQDTTLNYLTFSLCRIPKEEISRAKKWK